ncbi:Vps54-like protein-domain-containing protein [Fomitopsis serialis]|uniref:Vps54-like protein-domain-containing protein n=1 Tax=Fomitopsis serialis TaxID=139415 RepID=UPI002008CD09|nr:Vps54-like protein-domain-containing protein [Neoantrodia serialis]KAH9930608.1 Vps54-like protein-domain-containing protein [Neoantrodia serialis]
MSDDSSTPSRPPTPVAELPSSSQVRPYRFTWDPTSARKTGPGSVSATTEGHADYFGNATPYDLYGNASLASLQLGALPAEWSSAKHGFHAISTVVNSPQRRSAPPKAHSSLPSVPPADLPRHNAELGREGTAQLPTTPRPSGSFDDNDLPRTPRAQSGRAPPPLESVPQVFFDPSFNLGDPRIFNAVTEQGENGDSADADPSALSYSLPLLEKLSHHADTIEQHLVREISVRSTSFFAALSNLQDLQTESEQCLDRIGKLRGLLKDVDEKGARKGLEVVRRECKLRNMDSVKEGVKVVGGVVDMMGVAKSLVAAGQWGEALDVIDELDRLWDADSTAQLPTSKPSAEPSRPAVPSRQGTRSPLPPVPESPPESPKPPSRPAVHIPLSSLKAFTSLPAHLRALTMDITSALTSEFVSVLRLDLVERVDSDDLEPRKDNPDVSLKDRIRPLLQSLARTKGVQEAAVSWREVVMAEVRSMMRRRIPASDLEEDGKTSSLADELRAMSQPAFMDLARMMYRSLLRCIGRLYREGSIILEVLQAIRSPKASVDVAALQEELSGILSSAAELAHTRASRVVALRGEQHASLDLPSFVTLFNESWVFVVESEKICCRMIVGLRGTMISQAKTFLQTFHQAHISHSAKLVEDEQWNAAEVAPSIQRIVDLLVDASISDPPDLLLNRPPETPHPSSPLLSPSALSPQPTLSHRPASPLPSPNFPSVRPSASRTSTRRSSGPGKHLHIEDRAYFAVGATLEVLVVLADYLKIIINLEMLTTETMSRVIELLKAFNSRTCQVVLGAGAMRSAGLKNITARHLALASQSLSIVISLVPYIRETFRRHLSQKQAVMLVEFDKLKRDYQEHQNEIHQKLIAIMGDRLSAHIKSLHVRREVGRAKDGGVNDYMEVIVKDTVTLHKVLSRYLSGSVVEFVMTQVFAGINHRLSEEYTKIELPSQEAKERLLADARYLHQKLTGLKNVGAPTAMLEIIVQEKPVRVPTPAAHEAAAPQPTTQRFKGILQRTNSKRTETASDPTPPPVAPSPDPDAKLLPVALTSASRSEDALAMTQSPSASQVDISTPNGQGDRTSPDAPSKPLSPAAVPLPASSPLPTPTPFSEKQQPGVPMQNGDNLNGDATAGREAPVA